MEGYVYCFTNKSMPGLCKCGGTERNPEIRCKELFTTSLPTPCDVEFYIKVNDWRKAEKEIHQKIIEKGIKRFDRREWFNCKPEDIKNIYNNYYDKISIINKKNTFNNTTNNIINKNVTNNIVNNITKTVKITKYNMRYYCEKCNYKTLNKTEFSRHKLTSKHIMNTKKIYTCSICDNSFTASSSYYYHKKKCQENNNSDLPENNFSLNTNINENELKLQLIKTKYEYEIIKKDLENEKIKKDLEIEKIKRENNQEIIKMLQNTVDISNKIENTSIKIKSKTTSALKYANLNFKDTPDLLPLENYNIMNYNLEYDIDKKKLVEDIILNKQKKLLPTFFGKYIISKYKKDNLNEQSIFATDISRLNYIVKIKSTNNISKWKQDKNGVYICDNLIYKLINYHKDIILWYKDVLTIELAEDPTRPNQNIQKKLGYINDLLGEIESGLLIKETNKFIAPFFNLDK